MIHASQKCSQRSSHVCEVLASKRHLELGKKSFKVGNLYLNRGSTGAMVSRQAFGGFKMSGAGTKAGGSGYLKNFCTPRCITVNTMRRGFSPDLDLQ